MIEQKYIDRFHTKYVKQSSGCWEWNACRDSDGYGVFRNPIGDRAHRFSALIAGMDINNKLVCHHCDNPPCVNPAHLYAGTAKDNAQDTLNRNRHARRAYNGPRPWKLGELNHMATLTEEQIKEIKYSTLPQRVFAEKYNIDQSTVSNIRRGHTWSYV